MAQRATDPIEVGDEFEVDVVRVAHGGHCIAHHAGRTLFVRHALPGERVRVRVTDVTRKIVRADAVAVLQPSPERVPPPCRWAGPGGCGGCDLQHASLSAQRAGKTEVLISSLQRFAGIAPDHPALHGLTVEALPGEPDGLGWMTRVRWAVDPQGVPGLRRHRSHDVTPVDRCLLAQPGIETPASPRPATHLRVVGHRTWQVPEGVFWQVHAALPDALVAEVIAQARPEAGERWWDLFAGVGLFAAFLGEAVGGSGHVDAVESDAAAVACAQVCLGDLPQVATTRADVHDWVERRVRSARASVPTGIVLDPPRSGAGESLMRALLALAPRRLVYVACDPVALARDAGVALATGYALTAVRAFDAFPMTHHFETVALFEPADEARITRA